MSDIDQELHSFENDAFDTENDETPEPLTDQIISALQQNQALLPEGSSVASAATQGIRMAFRASYADEGIFDSGLALEVGDASVGNKSTRINLTVPSTHDVWFLHCGLAILPPFSYTDQASWYAKEDKSAGVRALIQPLLDKMGGVEVLRIPRTAADVSDKCNDGIDVVKEARFENFYYKLGGMRWPSRGPCGYVGDGALQPINGDGSEMQFLGYIAFPIGPIETMQTISLVVEDITKQMKDLMPWSEKFYTVKLENVTSPFGGLMPPQVDDKRNYGLVISANGAMQRSAFLEYPADDFVGIPRHKSHKWLRYYFKDTDPFPTPGKFVGITVRPRTLYPWFYQRTSPLLYSGCFFETKSYTSGTITGIVENSKKLYNEAGNVYEVVVRGVTIYIQSSDFYEYSIGESVSIIKNVEDHATSAPFTWMDLDDIQSYVDSLKEMYPNAAYVLFRGYQIIPVTFYYDDRDASEGNDDDGDYIQSDDKEV